MRLIGFVVSVLLSIVAFVVGVSCSPLFIRWGEMELCDLPFLVSFSHTLGMVGIFIGGAIGIGLLWVLIWKPFK